MRAGLFWLNDRQWARIEPHLPTGLTGPDRDDDRRIISGIIHMLQSGARWRDCPRDGPSKTNRTKKKKKKKTYVVGTLLSPEGARLRRFNFGWNSHHVLSPAAPDGLLSRCCRCEFWRMARTERTAQWTRASSWPVNRGARWMPWHQEPKKDVEGPARSLGELVDRALIRGFPNGETRQQLLSSHRYLNT